MLSSGRWDATSQLLDHGDQLQALMDRLPYLNRFAPERVFTGGAIGLFGL